MIDLKPVSVICMSSLILSACATKQYPIATELSSVEMKYLDCRELVIEQAKTNEIQRKIYETADVNWRSVAGFLGDYGIGNTMARSEAEQALAARQRSVQAALADKDCQRITAARSEYDDDSYVARALAASRERSR